MVKNMEIKREGAKSKAEVIAPIQNKKEVKLIASQLKQPGHTLFEINPESGTINPASFTLALAQFNGGTKYRVDVKPNCIYIQALNKKNAIKKLKRDY